jgi:hypothetical protein
MSLEIVKKLFHSSQEEKETVLITDSGSQVEHTKAYGKTRSKELGKITL